MLNDLITRHHSDLTIIDADLSAFLTGRMSVHEAVEFEALLANRPAMKTEELLPFQSDAESQNHPGYLPPGIKLALDQPVLPKLVSSGKDANLAAYETAYDTTGDANVPDIAAEDDYLEGAGRLIRAIALGQPEKCIDIDLPDTTEVNGVLDYFL